uniref:SCY1 like pseudokinase 3 n=1 Tax=Crocodylus porosus TaxID=8502 RepID=A0A7M4EB40_CROPO
MGSENSALKNNKLEKQPFTLPSGLKIYPAVLQDGKLASVFVYERENEDKVNKAAKHLKTLRHPCLLRFLSCTVETDGIHLVTERVKPLVVVLKILSSAEICAGIYDILLALVFLHERGNLTHNNVCLSSVFISEDGHWKLGGMETVCNLNEATPEFLRDIKSVRDQAGIPPEEMSADFCILSESHGHARDAYSFGTMIENLLTILNDQVSADILSSFQQTLHCTLLNPDPKCRPPLSSLLSHEFFRFLLDRVACLSEELIASRLVPLLLNQLVFAEPVAVKSFLPHLLGPKKDNIGDCHTSYLLSPALFQTHVIPVLLKLFEVHEEHVRMVLLSHIDTYAELFTRDELKNIILPQVLLGLRDSSDNIVAITLHSLAVLVSLLGPEVVVGGERSKIFKRSVPSFTKTTDLSPDDTTVCILSNQRNQLSQPLQKNSSSVYPKCPISETLPISSKKYPSRSDTHVALKMSGMLAIWTIVAVIVSKLRYSLVEQCQGKQDPLLSLNGLPEGINALGNSRSILSTSEKLSEEWPDWSESEDTETDKTVNIQIQTREPCSSAGPYFAEHNADEEPWDDFEPSSPNPELSSGNSLDVTTPDAVTGHRLFPPILQLSKESRSLKLSPPLKSTPVNSWSNDNWEHPDQLGKTTELPKTLQERPKSVMETGLGEEFTIQVKRKPVRDPELDWFADMIPDIKPSSALLLLPELRTESIGPNHIDTDSNSEDVSQIMPFSSKFAAVEVTEADAAGWDEEEELNWEDDTNW